MTHSTRYHAMSFLLGLALPLSLVMATPQPARAQDEQAVAISSEVSEDDTEESTAGLQEAVGAQTVVDAADPVEGEADFADEAVSDEAFVDGTEQADPVAGDPAEAEEGTVSDVADEVDQGEVATAGQEETPAAAFAGDAAQQADPAEDAPESQVDAKAASSLDIVAQANESAKTLNGVDISGWNPDTNLSVLPADFVIIKATEWNKSTGTYTSYTTNLSGNYASYIDQANAALAAGKKIGFYHFVTNPNASRNAGGKSYTEQAQGFIDAIKGYLGRAILVLDWENAQLANGTTYSVVESEVQGAKQWLDYVYQHTGVKPLIYMNKSCSNSYDWSSVKNAGYELWGAMYLYANADKSSYIEDPNYSSYGSWGAWGSRPTIYQYSSTATLPGSGGEIDVNIFYGNTSDWDRLANSTTRWIESNGAHYYLSNGSVVKNSWVVTDKSPNGGASSLQRYWVDATGKLATNRLLDKSETGYYAFAMPSGAVVRGAYAAGGKVYLADNDGRLANTGWVVSSIYGHGLQRYFVDATSHAAVVGYSASGWDHYTRPEGYVVRGLYTASNGYVYLANNDGKLEKAGWLVTDRYGQGTQRYYIDAKEHCCIPGFSSGGWNHYTTPMGYVARGRYVDPSGDVWIANNDGKLTSGKKLANGWLVTSALGQGLQRYWVENGDIVFDKLVKVSDTVWTFARPNGYVVRGKFIAPDGKVYLADNDGRLLAAGWHVSSAFGDGLQRYYVESAAHACVPGYSTSGYAHYTLPEGYVLRTARIENGEMRIADNDGLIKEGWVITSDFGQGLQRYWQKDGKVAKSQLIQTAKSSWTYCRPEGYVVRGKYTATNGYVYLANNDGTLEGTGWVVTKLYDGAYQRYYIDPAAHAAIPGYSSLGWAHYTRPEGYVLLNGKYIMNKKAYTANNDGKLSYSSTAASSITSAVNALANTPAELDSKWVLNALVSAGVREAANTSAYAFEMYNSYCTSTSTSALKVGMIVAVPTSSASNTSKTYGVVGIYLGDNNVMQFDGSKATKMTLSSWKSTYGKNATPKWGWFAGVELA